ncbi:MAG: hypothetical protein JSU86_14565 [Phycisphaerales bacterium]|nr:MAG: hypothetical protein JSU86_14565 [Phycisphaerales bacterium]
MAEEKKSPLNEIIQPFIDLVHAPRALWGINLAYVIEGMVYFGMLGYLAIHFSDFVFQGVEHADEHSHNMVMILTAGITIAMFFLGAVADKWGVRFALIAAFLFMLVGRAAMSGAPNVLRLEPARPGVFVGDKVNLHVTELDTLDGLKAVTGATVVANDNGANGIVGSLVTDLTAGNGTAPDASFESRPVRLGKAKLVKGEDQEWEVQYGSAPVTARLLIHSADDLGLYPGATVSLNSAYVTKRTEADEVEFLIRSHWLEDVAAVNTFPMDLAAGEGTAPDTSLESWRVRLSEGTLVQGEGKEWQVRYGRAPVTAQLRIDYRGKLDLCPGATISLNRAYVVKQEEDEDAFAIRTRWPQDVATVDTSGCQQAPDPTALADKLITDLSSGDGIAVDASLRSKHLQLGRGTVVRGQGHDWQVQYGSTPVTARLLIRSTRESGLCEGARISLHRARAVRHGGAGDDFVIRARWPDDIAAVDTFGCEESPYARMTTEREDLQRSDARWPVAEQDETPRAVSIAELRDLDDGPVNVTLSDAYVTYVRNGGYFLQDSEDRPGIFAIVSPLWSPLHLATILGILFVVFGYGMYQPAAYAGVRLFTTPKTAAMGFAMLYALMNLGGWLPTFAFLVRDEDFLGFGIPGTWWAYTGFTLVALFATITILTRRTVAAAIATAKAQTEAIKRAEEEKTGPRKVEKEAEPELKAATSSSGGRPPVHLHVLALAAIAAVFFRIAQPADEGYVGIGAFLGRYLYLENTWVWSVVGGLLGGWVVLMGISVVRRWVARHPLADTKFFFFIFCLIPVQTLFTYNWLILPQYINRAFEGWIGDYFEIFANANPILIFIAVPIIAAVTQKAKVYNMMIYGTFVMGAPAFLLTVGPRPWALITYILIMTIGEAMWQPRFLQYAAEIAPEGRTGQYMGVAQLPWFLTKVLVPWLYSGWMMDRYCPAEGTQNTEFMWLVFACIAMTSTILLLLAKRWVGKDFKTKAD